MEHNHNMPKNSEPKQSHDEVAKKAYDIYVKEGRPKGHDLQNWLEAETKVPHSGPNHHAHMAADFRKRFWISLILTLPILVLSPMLQKLAFKEEHRFLHLRRGETGEQVLKIIYSKCVNDVNF